MSGGLRLVFIRARRSLTGSSDWDGTCGHDVGYFAFWRETFGRKLAS